MLCHNFSLHTLLPKNDQRDFQKSCGSIEPRISLFAMSQLWLTNRHMLRAAKAKAKCKLQMDNITDAHSDFSKTSSLLVLRQPVTCLCICVLLGSWRLCTINLRKQQIELEGQLNAKKVEKVQNDWPA